VKNESRKKKGEYDRKRKMRERMVERNKDIKEGKDRRK
jgi:hypothetical protein